MPSKTTDADLDDIYDTIDLLMRNGKWNLLNELFQIWEQQAWRTDLDRLLGYATASFPAKSKIPSRRAFIEKCKVLHPEAELWKGLD